MKFLHHIGTFLLLVATVLLIVVSISAPVVNNIGLMTVNLQSDVPGSEVSFGTFGWCVQDQGGNDKDACSDSKVGYNPAQVMTAVDGTSFSDYAEKTSKALTRVMVLHPVAAGLSFIAFILALGAGMFGSFLASLVAALTFLVTLVALICDFVAFGIIKSNVNDEDNGTGSNAYFSVGLWCVLVAGICNFLASIIVFFTCCTGRVKKRREQRKMESHHSPPRRRRFWQRRQRGARV